jgi:predicted nucleotidyltransferase
MKHEASGERRKRYDEAARRAASFVKQEYPHLAGIMIQGSVARREPGPFSDIDIIAVTHQRRKPAEFSFFEGDIYVPVGFRTVAELEKEFKDPMQFFWARGSAKSSTRILYDPQGVLAKIMRRGKHIEPSHHILEKCLWDMYHHTIEYSGKLRNGWSQRDEYMTRYAARIIAQSSETAVTALNDMSVISENYVWHQVLKAKKKPRHFRTDYTVALGIVGTSDTSKVFKSAMRLCRETLRLIRDEFEKRARHKQFRELLAEPLEKHGL